MRLTFGDELDHGLLPCRQSSLAGARPLQQKALEERLRDFACEEGLVIGECLNGGDEKAARIGLKKESTCTSLEHVPDEGIRIVHREDQDLHSRKLGSDLPRRLNSVERRKAKIENGDVWAGSESKLDGLFAVGSFRDDLPARVPRARARMPKRTAPHYTYFKKFNL